MLFRSITDEPCGATVSACLARKFKQPGLLSICCVSADCDTKGCLYDLVHNGLLQVRTRRVAFSLLDLVNLEDVDDFILILVANNVICRFGKQTHVSYVCREYVWLIEMGGKFKFKSKSILHEFYTNTNPRIQNSFTLGQRQVICGTKIIRAKTTSMFHLRKIHNFSQIHFHPTSCHLQQRQQQP